MDISALLHGLVGDLGTHGFGPRRIVLLGFSQGACLVTEYAVRHATRYGGIIAFTGGLIGPPGSSWNFGGGFDGAPVFLGTSDVDEWVPASRVAETAEVLTGLGARSFNWQESVQLQHQLRPNIALNVGYFHTSWGAIQKTENTAVTPADFDPFCVTAPRDARLPGGGGYQVCGLYDVTPAKFGQSARPSRSPSTCASSRPPIATSKRRKPAASSARTSTTGSTSCPSRCRRSPSGGKTFHCSRRTSSAGWPSATSGPCRRSRRMPWRC